MKNISLILLIVSLFLFWSVALAKEAKERQEYTSPDGRYRAVVIPLPKAPYGSGESKIEIRTTKDAVLCSESYGSEDGVHGFGVEHAAWTSDSKFFVYSMSSSGGHQAWHFPTYFIAASDFKIRSLDNYLGLITDPAFELIEPDIIHVVGHSLDALEKEADFRVSLSK